MQEIAYPTWRDVGLPDAIVGPVRALRAGQLLDYLVLNRVFRFAVKPQYVYRCAKCQFVKRLNRPYDDYTNCDQCGSNKLTSSATWRMGKDNIEPYSIDEKRAPIILQQMSKVYAQYFNCYPPDDFVDAKWVCDNSKIKLPKVDGIVLNEEDAPVTPPVYRVKFCCGEAVSHQSAILATCRAAVLCPFLWDELFDWKYLTKREKGRETHIIPLLHMWLRLSGSDAKSKPARPRQLSSEFILRPSYQRAATKAPGNDNVVDMLLDMLSDNRPLNVIFSELMPHE